MAIEFPATIELRVNDKPEKFKLDFDICENPDCDCNGVNMVIYNEDNEIKFFLDFATESYRENNYSEEEAEIINALIAFLKSNEGGSLNIGFFKRNYEYVKEKVRGKRDAIASFRLGTLLLYREVLWEEDDIKLKINDKKYLVFDGYCVTPDCVCKDVALSFFEDVHKLGVREPDFSFVYDYITGIYRDPIGISEVQVENIIKMIPESLEKKFKKRHAKLKKEVKKDIQRKIKEKGFVPKETGKRKLGRNEPCHCGSGKKYKKCCLNKDIEKYGRAIKVRY